MKIQVLNRYEPLSDWQEVYINGELIYDGEAMFEQPAKLLLEWFAKQDDMDVEIRSYTISTEITNTYDPPLYSMTGKNYWSDWEKANADDS